MNTIFCPEVSLRYKERALFHFYFVLAWFSLIKVCVVVGVGGMFVDGDIVLVWKAYLSAQASGKLTGKKNVTIFCF